MSSDKARGRVIVIDMDALDRKRAARGFDGVKKGDGRTTTVSSASEMDRVGLDQPSESCAAAAECAYLLLDSSSKSE